MKMDIRTWSADFGGREVTIETGRMAKQANGAVVVRYGDTVVLVTATMGDPRDENFLPLTVNYQENFYSAGRIPGGFFKREGRPSVHEVLTCRLIDRPIRPLFPNGYCTETQIFAFVLSADEENTPDIPAMLGTSAALLLSDIPFATPIVAVRIGRIGGEFVVNPSAADLKGSELDLTVVCSEEGIVMVEGGADFVDEAIVVDALLYAREVTAPLIELQKKMVAEAGKTKMEVAVPPTWDAEFDWLAERYSATILDAAQIADKLDRYKQYSAIKKEAAAAFAEAQPECPAFGELFDRLKKKVVRRMILDGKRNDGRDWTTVRPIDIVTRILPRPHGSSLFTRGETQALVTTTLGTADDELKQDHITHEYYKRFYLHYNFPPFSVGEARRFGGPGRREIGHGLLAERGLSRTLPEWDDYPYTIRIVSDILESNGSSSMASVCGGCLSLMDAGVPIKEPIAGIAMGLIEEGDEVVVLTDILGDEDHLGDMDFKVTGGASGITAIQMDIKISKVTRELLQKALSQAKAGRDHILGKMIEVMPEPRKEMSPFAPRYEKLYINPDKIRDVIGPGGKMIRSIVDETGAKIDISDDGEVFIFSRNLEGAELAKQRVEAISAVPEEGQIYEGLVKKVVDFGAFVEILPGTDGLLHISELEHRRVENVTDVVREGDVVKVKVLGVQNGKVKLSRKALIER